MKASGVLDTGSDCETEKDQPETLSLCCHGIPGNPCMFHKSLIPELLQLTGDQGGRKVLKQHTCRYVEIEDEKELMDIDVPVYWKWWHEVTACACDLLDIRMKDKWKSESWASESCSEPGKIKKLKIVLTNILPGDTIVELAERTAGNTQTVNHITTNSFEKS